MRPGKNGKLNNEDYAEGEYGPKTGIWRILRMLDEVNVKTTFLTCGGIAERYPDAMKAIAERGHEVAGHGYHHDYCLPPVGTRSATTKGVFGAQCTARLYLCERFAMPVARHHASLEAKATG